MTQPPYGPGPEQPSDRPQDRPQDLPRDPTRPFPTYGRPTEPHAQQTGSAGGYGAAGSSWASGSAGAAGSSWAAPGQPPYAQSQYGQAQYGQAGQAPYGHGYAPGQYPAQYGQPPAAYGYGYGYPEQGGTNGLATAALVCGLGGFVIGISAPVAIGLGIAALVQISRRQQAGKGMAIAGLVIGSVVTLGYLLLFGLVIAVGTSADDDYGAPDSGQSSGPAAYVDELVVGECFNDTKTEDEVVRQPCTTEHDGEIVAIVTLPSGRYPGNNGIDKAADRACRPEFGTYVGKPSDQSELYLNWWTPDKSAWDHGDRRVLCAAYGPDEKITGTVKNSRR